MTGDDEHVSQQQAMDALQLWLKARDERAEADERVEAARKVLDLYLAETGERELMDGESGRGCRLQPRRGSPVYDLVGLRQRDPALFDRLFALGAIQVNHKVAQTQEHAGQVAGLGAWRMPGAVSDALVEASR